MKKQVQLIAFIFAILCTSVGYSQACGEAFTDPAGATANYDSNTDYTITICPSNPGDLVTVTFTEFNTEATWDALYVFNGNSTSSPQISSGNGAGNVPGGLTGGYWGTTIPGPFTSTSPDGCLTFRFRSDSVVNNPGWIANVTCAPPPTCPKPNLVTISSITSNSLVLGWTETGAAANWQCLALPVGSPAPTAATPGFVDTSVNPFVITGLTPNTCYTFYVRSVCDPTDMSNWSVGSSGCTTPLPPTCGGQFVDNGGATGNYASSSDNTTTICPTNAGDVVTVTFSSFNTEATWDALYVFDGNSLSSTQISSTNPAVNVPGGLAGGYWGSAIPGPFTSSSPDGCLTFRFRSDSSYSLAGWVANVTCAPPVTCLKPTALITSTVTSNSLTLGWTENSGATSWEVITLPCGTAPSGTSTGVITSSNPYTITGLNPGTCYTSFVRAICSATDESVWSYGNTANTNYTAPANDECIGAIVVPVNHNSCSQITAGTLNGATPSAPPLAATCVGVADDDIWFQFVATDTKIVTSVQSVTGTTQNLNLAVYSGTCGALTLVNCSAYNSSGISSTGLIIGQTYYLRVYSNLDTPQTVTFNLCVSTESNCEEAQSICGVNNYVNSTGSPSLGTIGCLYTTPNPTYFSIKISSSGSVNMLLTQTSIGGTAPNLDVDYVAWGPFASQSDACNAISGGAPNLTGLTTGCSYSAAPTEHFNLANAIAGEYYIILITNFSNQAGFINVIVEPTSTGSIDCTGIRLNAFLDTNGNGTQEIGEQNFPLGQFQYEVNSDGNVHHITSPSGTYTLYDATDSNTYDLGYTINPDYNLMYSTTVNYTAVAVASGSMTTYNFPVTITENYNDLAVVIVPENAPRAGTTYRNKVVYTNLGNQTLAAGTLTFNNNVGTTITAISQTGTTSITNGFTYNFTNLLPFESRTITVSIAVPSIPTVSIGQLLTNTASIIPPTGDVVATNNTSSSTQAITGSYDPNDKTESHGDKILFSSFTPDDYLYYTIRFENTGTTGALDITVSDLLDSQLDETTLVMINASHSYTLDRLGKSLIWNFENIQLPVSVPDTTIGKGFITFKIKPNLGYAVGDIIPNTANIYFDSNPAIVTNTFNTEFVQTLGNPSFNSNTISLYPNPTTNLVTISNSDANDKIATVMIYDISGKRIYTLNKNTLSTISIDVSNFARGLYLVELTSESNTKITKKLLLK